MAASAQAALNNRKVTVDRERLIKTLKENKESHISKFLEAIEGYTAMAQQQLEAEYQKEISKAASRFEKLKLQVLEFDSKDPSKQPQNWTVIHNVTISIPVPKNYSEMYQTAINMMEWDTRKEVELTYSEFQCFVQDEWDWKEEFELVTSGYMGFKK